MDLLSDPNVRGFLAGATNILFKQKRDLVDVVVEMSEGGSVEFSDPAIKKLLTLTTEDLRFGECLVTNVFKEMGNSTEPGDCWMDGVGTIRIEHFSLLFKNILKYLGFVFGHLCI